MNKAGNKADIRITGTFSNRVEKVEKKIFQSIRIPTGDNYFIQTTVWVPNTPGYSKAPKVVLTLNSSRDKIQILFPGTFDLLEFTATLQRFCDSISKEVNAAHNEAVRDYAIFHELLSQQADKRAKTKAEEEFLRSNQNNEI
jgi:hypothetical protein